MQCFSPSEKVFVRSFPKNMKFSSFVRLQIYLFSMGAQDRVLYIKVLWDPTEHRRTIVMQAHHFKNNLLLARTWAGGGAPNTQQKEPCCKGKVPMAGYPFSTVPRETFILAYFYPLVLLSCNYINKQNIQCKSSHFINKQVQTKQVIICNSGRCSMI